MIVLSDQNVDQIVKWLNIGGVLVPVIVSTIAELRKVFTDAGVDPALFDAIEARINARIALSDQEADAHGHPRIG